MTHEELVRAVLREIYRADRRDEVLDAAEVATLLGASPRDVQRIYVELEKLGDVTLEGYLVTAARSPCRTPRPPPEQHGHEQA